MLVYVELFLNIMINGNKKQHDELKQLCIQSIMNWTKKWIFKCIYMNQDVLALKLIYIMSELVKSQLIFALIFPIKIHI